MGVGAVSKWKSKGKTSKKGFQKRTDSSRERDIFPHTRIRVNRSDLLVCLFLIATIFVLYSPILRHDFISLDDDLYITENHHVREGLTRASFTWAFTATHASNWHPLTWLSHILDCQLYGLKPGGHHLTSLVFHIVNAVLLFIVLTRMTGARWRSGFAAALFAFHPLHVESVAWVAERKDVLSTFFWILTIWMYARYVERPGLSRYMLPLFTMALGLMAKPMLVTLPFVLLLLDYWPLARFRPSQTGGQSSATTRTFKELVSPFLRLFLEKIPFFVLASASSIVTFLVQKGGGAVAPLEVYSIKIRIANSLVSYVKYMGKMIWPHPLSVYYPHPGDDLSMWKAVGAGVLLLCISILVVLGMRRYRFLALGWFWYLGTLVPVIGLVQVGTQAMADRYTYVPLIGLYITIAWGIPEFLAGWRHRRMAILALASAAIWALMMCSWLQIQLWKNSLRLFEYASRVTSGNWVIHNNLGLELEKDGRLEEALHHYKKSLEINPSFCLAHSNLGVALEETGRLDEAVKHYYEALRIKPDFAAAHYNLANFLKNQGRLEEAVKHYYEALRIKPDFADAHYNLAIFLKNQGRLEEAVKHYYEALRVKPNYADVHNSLGIALGLQGRLEEAVKHYYEALKIEPNDAQAHNRLGIALAKQGSLREAMEHFSEALRIEPDYADAHNNLGSALAQQGRLEEAVGHFSEALRIKPDSIEVRNNLLSVQQQMGQSPAVPNSVTRP